MNRTSFVFGMKLHLMLFVVALLMGVGTTRLPAAEPADPKLAVAYRRCYFTQQYPPDMVREIQDKLQNAPRALDVLTQLAKDPRPQFRILVTLLLGALAEADGAKILWALLADENESVRLAASGALIQLNQLTPVAGDVAATRDKRPEVRRLAIATLGRLAAKNDETALLQCLNDEDELVRAEAVTALQGKKGKEVEDGLLERLKDKSAQVRWTAARALGTLADAKNQAVIDGLETALKDPDWHVRAAALMSLGKSNLIKNDKIADTITGILNADDFALVRDRAADVLLAANSDKVAEALAESMVSTNRATRFHTSRAMRKGRITAALPFLMKHCDHPNPEVRELIMQVFGEIGGSEQLPAVTKAANDPDARVRLAAVTALQELVKRGNADSLVAKLDDPDPHVRAAAARAVGQTGTKSVVPKLISLLRDGDSFVRGAAAEALGKLGDRSAVPALLGLLSGEGIGKEGSGLLISATNDTVAATLKMSEVEQKGMAALALGELQATEAVDSLIKYGLQSPDAELRATSAYSLGKIGDRRAVGPLQDVVREYYATVPANVDITTVIDPGTAVVPDSERKRREKEVRVRRAVVWALGEIGDPAAREILTRATGDQNSLVRDFAVEALAKIAEREERARLLTEKNPPKP